MSAPDNTQNPVAGSPAKLCAVTAGMDIQFFKEGPGKPQINSAEDMNVLVAILRSMVNMQITRGDSDKVIISDGNWVIQIAQDLTKLTQIAGSGGGTTAQQYRLKSVQGDYVTCHTWDGTTEGSTSVFIAKEWWLRTSLTGFTDPNGNVHVFTYPGGTTGFGIFRTDTVSGNAQNQVVCPPFTLNELIYALPVDHTGVAVSGTELTLVMTDRSALWCFPG
jgi:hypothetical protein